MPAKSNYFQIVNFLSPQRCYCKAGIASCSSVEGSESPTPLVNWNAKAANPRQAKITTIRRVFVGDMKRSSFNKHRITLNIQEIHALSIIKPTYLTQTIKPFSRLIKIGNRTMVGH